MLIRGVHNYFSGRRRGVIHVGANIGEERDWYHDRGFTKVLWFEANPELMPQLRENLKEYSNQIALGLGIHDTLKRGVLHIANNAGQSSSLLDFGTHAEHHPQVKFIKDIEVSLWRLDTLFDTMGWNIEDYCLLNVDVEGVELNVMKSMGDLIGKLDYVYSEVSVEEVHKEGALLYEVDMYLAKYGFERRVQVIKRAGWGDALYIKTKSNGNNS